jgi:hypothetical protein
MDMKFTLTFHMEEETVTMKLVKDMQKCVEHLVLLAEESFDNICNTTAELEPLTGIKDCPEKYYWTCTTEVVD